MRWLWLCAVLSGCATHMVPRASRPNTESLVGFLLSDNVRPTLIQDLISTAPVENARCLYGSVRDTLPNMAWSSKFKWHHLVVVIDSIGPPQIVHADEFGIMLGPAGKVHGCPMSTRLVGIAHSHTIMTPTTTCSNSPDDALTLFHRRDMLLGLVFCLANGLGEVLWQDGRRSWFQWLPLPERPYP